MKTEIPAEVLDQVESIVKKFNDFELERKRGFAYFTTHKGNLLYLNRLERNDKCPLARLTFTGDFNNWQFAIFKYSSEQYDPDEDYFPGCQHLNGTIEGALKAVHEAYPIFWKP